MVAPFRPAGERPVLPGSLRVPLGEERLTLYGYFIMANHCHLLAAVRDIGKTMASFKSFTAGQIVMRRSGRHSPVLELLACHQARHQVDREHQVWQAGSQPVLIEGEAMMLSKLAPIHRNPVAQGDVDDPRSPWARYRAAGTLAPRADFP